MSTVAHWNLAPASRKRNGQRTTSGASAVESTMCRLGIGGFLRSAQQEVADEFDRLFGR